MQFRITGRIVERESGLPVPSLDVRAYDRDLIYDDLLGTAVTDADGRFELGYDEKDFRELFETKPDLYLSVYARPCRLVLDTREAVRWNAGKAEHFDLQIDRARLGDAAPSRPDGLVGARVGVAVDQIELSVRDGFVVPKAVGFGSGSTPGAPALLERMHYVALPRHGAILGLEVVAGPAVALPVTQPLLPVQAPVPDVGTDPKAFGDGVEARTHHLRFTTPDARIYEGRVPYPERLVELVRVEEVGPIRIAALRVRPLQYDASGARLLAYPELRFEVKFDAEEARRRALEEQGDKRRGLGEHTAATLQTLLDREIVTSAKDLFWPKLVPEETPHVIVTDSYAWPEAVERGDGTTRAPSLAERGAALAGDVVAEFERLAQWKTARGVRSRVVTISEIVAKTHGDFTEGDFARDLQEVVRNFLKWAHATWGTAYVLLGGDVNVVPMRRLVGVTTYGTVGCGRVVENPPPDAAAHVVGGGIVKLHPSFLPGAGDPLATVAGALRIPFDREAGPGRLGWYFTSEADFEAKNDGFTRLDAGMTSQFVIVEGPAAVLDDDYYWVRDVNAIPSDLYYASLVGPGYSKPGRHDFDRNHNELYGQDPDDVDMWSDVWVGRASVESAAQAAAFVNKNLAYERLETVDGQPLDASYLNKVLYASAYWGRETTWLQADTSIAPAENRFTHVAGSGIARMALGFDLVLTAGNPDRRLVARIGDTQLVVPYNPSATTSNLGWYFTTNDTHTTKSAVATRFIKVLGPEAEVNATWFFWDPVGLELSSSEKEYLRGQMNLWYPEFQSVQRHYEDYFDLSAPPSIVPLEEAPVRAAIDAGVHFLSLSGHGWWGGCCGINVSAKPNFENQGRYFIGFGHSCSTARPDGADSLAEVSTLDSDGGAVGYVGNTRYGWIGVGDNFEEFFWAKLRLTQRLGPAAGLRLATQGVTSVWTSYTQTLFGDPEMWVWTKSPELHEVTHPNAIAWGTNLQVTVRKLGVPVADHKVTVLAGWTNSATKPRWLQSKATNGFGQASFTLPSGGTKPSHLSLTVTRPNFKPYVVTLPVT